MTIKNFQKIEGIVAPNETLLDSLMGSVKLAASMHTSLQKSEDSSVNRMALLSAIHTVNSLLAASSAQCTLASPPADIDMAQDSTGSLIYRCQHSTSHRWNLNGQRI